MKHQHWFWFIYRDWCAPCRVRRLTYAYRFEPQAQRAFWWATMNDLRFTVSEKNWIARQVRPMEIGDE